MLWKEYTNIQLVADNFKDSAQCKIKKCGSCVFVYQTPLCSMWYGTEKVKWSHYKPSVAQRVGRGIALLFHDRGTRRGWVVSSTPQPHFTPGKDPVPIAQEAGWAPGLVWTGGKSSPHRDSIPDHPAHSSVTIPTELPGPRYGTVAYSKCTGCNIRHPMVLS